MKTIGLSVVVMLSARLGFAQEVVRYGSTDSVFIRQYSFSAAPATVQLMYPGMRAAIPQNLYTQHLPFFCRQELKMQQAHVPVTFRLGSMENCNQLEQKPGYR